MAVGGALGNDLDKPDASLAPTTSPTPGITEPVPSDARELAQKILQKVGEGSIWIDPLHVTQLDPYAIGGVVPADCKIDTRIMQVILIAQQRFGTISVSSLNRRCTQELYGLGEASMHWQGRAVDFSVLGGTILTGNDAESIAMVKILDQIAPADSGVGQAQCRSPITTRIAEYRDGCNHLHFELGWSDEPLIGQ